MLELRRKRFVHCYSFPVSGNLTRPVIDSLGACCAAAASNKLLLSGFVRARRGNAGESGGFDEMTTLESCGESLLCRCSTLGLVGSGSSSKI